MYAGKLAGPFPTAQGDSSAGVSFSDRGVDDSLVPAVCLSSHASHAFHSVHE
jgi:hypothetical protein